MGLDGGTYITRSDILRGQSWAMATADNSRSTRGGDASTSSAQKKVDDHTARLSKWSTCSISGQPLHPPLAADFLGSMYNREAIVEFLLGRCSSFADEEAEHRYANQLREGGQKFEHLTSLRDVFTVRLTPGKQVTNAQVSTEAGVPYVCPVTGLSCLRYPFTALPDCGHAFSSRAVAQMQDSLCGLCEEPFQREDLVPLNGTPEQIQDLRRQLDRRRAKKASKKGSKATKRKHDAVDLQDHSVFHDNAAGFQDAALE